MALPKCPKCDWTMFQTTEIEPANSKFKLIMVHCAKCGCAIGVTEFYNTGALIHLLAKKMNIILK